MLIWSPKLIGLVSPTTTLLLPRLLLLLLLLLLLRFIYLFLPPPLPSIFVVAVDRRAVLALSRLQVGAAP